MNTPRILAAAALLSLGVSAAQAQGLHVSGNGENLTITYDEAYTGNIVGGGRVAGTTIGKDPKVTYADNSGARQAPGIPFFVGGERGDVVYLPAGSSPGTLAQR